MRHRLMIGRDVKIERLIRAVLPRGFRWKVIVDGKTVENGTTDTESEARDAAEKAIEKLRPAETQK